MTSPQPEVLRNEFFAVILWESHVKSDMPASAQLDQVLQNTRRSEGRAKKAWPLN